ncbi:MAG: hypothetical protein Q9M15_03080 [Mariprofundaceae bacterium]|nr:hypothetical protein [Mariprofundaceae bacterium]
MKKYILIAAAVATMGLTACGSSTTPPAPGVVSLSGVVSKGPINGGTVRVVDSAKPVHRYFTTTDAYGAYNLPLDVYAVSPYTLTISKGIDRITGQIPDFPVSTIVVKSAGSLAQIANVNVLSTVIAAAAKAAAGGKPPTAAQLKTQEIAVVKSLGMGLPAGISPTTDASAANAAQIASANEALAEVIRRSTVAGNKAVGTSITTSADLEDSMAALAADISDGSLDGYTTQAALRNAGAVNVTVKSVASVVTKTAEIAKETTKVVLEAAAQGGAVNVTDVYTGVTTIDSYVTAKKVLNIAVQQSITTVLTAQGKRVGTIATVVKPSAAAVVAQTSASTAAVTNAVKTATTNANTALTAAKTAVAGTPAGNTLIAQAKVATADAYAVAQVAAAVTADNYTAAVTFSNASVANKAVATSLLTSANKAQTSTAALVTATAAADVYSKAANFTAAQTTTAVAVTKATKAATLATTSANTAATVAAPVVLKAFVLGGNALTYSGQAGVASTVDVYGIVKAPVVTMPGTAITLSGRLVDLTGLGARSIVTSFEFGVQQVGGSRKVQASINPVNIVVNAAGDVRVNVPAGAVITYNYVNAAGTGFNGTASNIAANNGIIVSNTGAFTVNVSKLSSIITAKTNAGLNILATVGTFSYTAGFTNVNLGHESRAGAVDSLFNIDAAITGTRALQGKFRTN